MKSEYTITPNSNINIDNYHYHLNNSIHQKKIIYGIAFIEINVNMMLNIFQSDCDVINHYLNITYNYDAIGNP